MHSGILIIFCGTLVLVNTYPAVVFDYYNPHARDVKAVELRDNYQSSDFNQSPCVRSHNGDVKCFIYDEIPENIPETPEYLSISNVPIGVAGRELNQDQTIYEQSDYLETLAPTGLLPLNPDYSPYHYENSPIRTYIHGLIPQDTSDFYGDIYPEDPSPFNRLARRTTSYEEFLAQLSHDAQMNNILPTMSFVRTAGPHYYVPYGSGPAPVRASFPQAVGGCARPLLFSCSPTIYKGILAPKGYPYAPVVPVLTSPSYKESLQNHKSVHNKVSPVNTNKKEHHEIHQVLKDSIPDNYLANSNQ